MQLSKAYNDKETIANGVSHYFQNHAKSMPNSSLNKSNPSQNTKLVSWGIEASSTTQKLVISNTPNSI